MPSRSKPSIDRIREVLSYDPETGNFRWKRLDSGRNKSLVAGTLHSRGYWTIGVGSEKYLAHRLAWFFMTGRWPENEIDHINGDKLDNRWCNLRTATRSENVRNGITRLRNKSGYKGVSFHAITRKWVAWIMSDRKRRYLGLHATPEEAHAAYCRAASELHGEFANHG